MKSFSLLLIKIFLTILGLVVYYVGTMMNLNMFLKHTLVFILVFLPWSYTGKKSNKGED
jgi:hypothetical protein